MLAERSLVPNPLVIAHRGASGYLPEHTLESYERAIDLGADFIEPDLVSTKDGILVARHENEISGTTDVDRRFPARKKTKQIDGKSLSGWFTEDFTLAELKTLRAKERLATRSQANNGKFLVPTFEEVILLALRKGKERGQPVGIYPETKHPSYFRSIGLALEPKLVKALDRHGLNRSDAPVFVQSFEVSNLKELKLLVKVPLVQLLDEESERPYDFILSGDPRTYGDLMKDEGLRELATYAKGIGPWKQSIVGISSTTDLVKRAHRFGLLVHPYTFRSDPDILPARYQRKPEAEYLEFLRLGVDGFFSDFTDHAVSARDLWRSETL